MFAERPLLPEGVDRRLDDLETAWDSFEVFEAFHHAMAICNPLTSDQLDRVVAAISVHPGTRVLDIACGHGELLIRLAAIGAEGLGIDISPWALTRAHQRAAAAGVGAMLRWRLQDGAEIDNERYDIASCLGASWIFDGVDGTLQALDKRCLGTLVFGELVLSGPATDASEEAFGLVHTKVEIDEKIESRGFSIVESLTTGKESWDRYQSDIERSAASYAADHPGPKSDDFVADQRAWRRQHADAVQSIDWAVWVAERR